MSRISVLVVVFGLVLAGCAGDIRYRSEVAIADDKVCQFDMEDKSPAVRECPFDSTEAHQLPRKADGSQGEAYRIHFVEFDDEGAPHQGRIVGSRLDQPETEKGSQIDAALRQIRELLDDPSQCVQLVVFAHGWQNNAEFDNGNVVSFRSFMRKLAIRNSETATNSPDTCFGHRRLASAPCPANAPRCTGVPPVMHKKLVGLYVGWRGKTLNLEGVNLLTFWDRKSAAERVARGSVRELFGRLSVMSRDAQLAALYADSNKPASRLRTYVIGHSFGGDIVYQSTAQSLVDSLVDGLDQDEPQAAVASRFVDMLVLVNPAVEAQRFDPVFRAAKERPLLCVSDKVCTPPYQAPLLAIFTSENDSATHIAFPVGRFFSTILVHPSGEREGQAVRETIGWNDDFVTHTLQVSQDCAPTLTPALGQVGGTDVFPPAGWAWCVGNPFSGTPGDGTYDPGQGTGAKAFLLRHQPDGFPGPRYNGPIWNVRVSKEIIDGHNGIWRLDFLDYLTTLFTDEVDYPFVATSQ